MFAIGHTRTACKAGYLYQVGHKCPWRVKIFCATLRDEKWLSKILSRQMFMTDRSAHEVAITVRQCCTTIVLNMLAKDTPSVNESVLMRIVGNCWNNALFAYFSK